MVTPDVTPDTTHAVEYWHVDPSTEDRFAADAHRVVFVDSELEAEQLVQQSTDDVVRAVVLGGVSLGRVVYRPYILTGRASRAAVQVTGSSMFPRRWSTAVEHGVQAYSRIHGVEVVS